MALAPSVDKKRVKVYELKNNDWYDRGTGFCVGTVASGPNAAPEHLDARIIVTSEDNSSRTLLETQIYKDDSYQKQQETLIVWTEHNGVDMALSFQEAEGCTQIWEFVSTIQNRLVSEDGVSDDMLEPAEHPMILPEPVLGRLDDVVDGIRTAQNSPQGRDTLAKFIMSPDQMYILKLAPLVEEAERRESVQDLHKLCMIMKSLILLNDTSIIEFIVTDQAIMGVVGALEYDPDFPSHRANHRQYLSDTSKFKEVVKIEHPDIKRKIHYTYRLLYLKDVVLARILDDPTFSVLNSLIFFHQVDIVNHLQSNQSFLQELFTIFGDDEPNWAKKKEAVLFIQNCCAVAKNIQVQQRAQLYQNFLAHGLFDIIIFSLKHHDAAVRVAGTDVLVSLIDHDAPLVRSHIFKAISEKTTPLTDFLIDLLLVEVDLGVKSQMADAIKILFDPFSGNTSIEAMNRQANADSANKQRGPQQQQAERQISPQTQQFIQSFYDDGARRLFQPLKDLENRPSMLGLSVQETSLFTHLVEILCFFVRQHQMQGKVFILQENLHARIAQLLSCPQKHIKLIAIKWFRICVGLQDDFHMRQLIQHKLFEPILNIVYESMPRDNLLNSACLELFEYIRREQVKQLVYHLVETYRERLMGITYVNTFQGIVLRYEQLQNPQVSDPNGEGNTSFTTEPDTPEVIRSRALNGRAMFQGLKEPDADEDAYFNGDDDDGDFGDEDGFQLPLEAAKQLLNSGRHPVKPLVDYPDDDDDDDDEEMDVLASFSGTPMRKKSGSSSRTIEQERGRDRKPVPMEGSPGHQKSPPELKRRRSQDDDEDELGKLMGGGSIKRRNSSVSLGSSGNVFSSRQSPQQRSREMAAAPAVGSPTGIPYNEHNENDSPMPESPRLSHHGHPPLRRKGSLKVKNEGPSNPGRFSIKALDGGEEKNTPSTNGRSSSRSAG